MNFLWIPTQDEFYFSDCWWELFGVETLYVTVSSWFDFLFWVLVNLDCWFVGIFWWWKAGQLWRTLSLCLQSYTQYDSREWWLCCIASLTSCLKYAFATNPLFHESSIKSCLWWTIDYRLSYRILHLLLSLLVQTKNWSKIRFCSKGTAFHLWMKFCLAFWKFHSSRDLRFILQIHVFQEIEDNYT